MNKMITSTLTIIRCLAIVLLCFYYRISNLLNSRAVYRQNFYSTNKIHSAENSLSESLFSLYFYISKKVRNLTSIFVPSRLKTPLFRKGATGVKCNTNSRNNDDRPMNSPNLNHIFLRKWFFLWKLTDIEFPIKWTKYWNCSNSTTKRIVSTPRHSFSALSETSMPCLMS